MTILWRCLELFRKATQHPRVYLFDEVAAWTTLKFYITGESAYSVCLRIVFEIIPPVSRCCINWSLSQASFGAVQCRWFCFWSCWVRVAFNYWGQIDCKDFCTACSEIPIAHGCDPCFIGPVVSRLQCFYQFPSFIWHFPILFFPFIPFIFQISHWHLLLSHWIFFASSFNMCWPNARDSGSWLKHFTFLLRIPTTVWHILFNHLHWRVFWNFVLFNPVYYGHHPSGFQVFLLGCHDLSLHTLWCFSRHYPSDPMYFHVRFCSQLIYRYYFLLLLMNHS